MSNVIVRGFANVARFSGRDTRSQFWPYCGAALGLYLLVGWALLIPTMAPVIGGTPPPPTAVQSMISRFMLISALLFFALVALLAGAVSRRLHDSGRSAYWGLMPFPFVAYSLTMMASIFPKALSGEQPNMLLFFSVFASNVVYMATIVALIVFLTRPSTPTPNRYG